MAEEKKDWVPAAALGVGAVGVVAGIYFYAKKPKGVDPGDVFTAKFIFDYSGEGGTYILQVSLGRIYPLNIFDHVEGLHWELGINLPAPATPPQQFEFEVECLLPGATSPGTYDGEALIRTLSMDRFDYLIRALAQNVITVRKV